MLPRDGDHHDQAQRYTDHPALERVPAGYTLTVTEAANAGKAKIRGLELGLNIASFTMLPGFLSHFGATANVTFVDFDAPRIQMADGVTYRQLPQLLESSKFIANAALFYRQDRFSGEVAWNHTSAQPLSFDRTNAANDQWYRDTDTVDAQVAYRITKSVEFRIQGKNLTDETNQKVVGPNHALNYSLLDNGRAYYLGVGFAF